MVLLSDHHTGFIYAPQFRTVAELDENTASSWFKQVFIKSIRVIPCGFCTNN